MTASVDLEGLMSSLAEAKVKAGKLPPVNDWQPSKRYRINIRIDREGRWYYQNSEIRRWSMVKLFASILRKDDDGYALITPQEKLLIKVDSYPLVANQVAVDRTTNSLVFAINTGEQVTAGRANPIRVKTVNDEPEPVILVRDKLNALIHRNVFYELVELANQEQQGAESVLFVESNGCRFDLGRF